MKTSFHFRQIVTRRCHIDNLKIRLKKIVRMITLHHPQARYPLCQAIQKRSLSNTSLVLSTKLRIKPKLPINLILNRKKVNQKLKRNLKTYQMSFLLKTGQNRKLNKTVIIALRGRYMALSYKVWTVLS